MPIKATSQEAWVGRHAVRRESSPKHSQAGQEEDADSDSECGERPDADYDVNWYHKRHGKKQDLPPWAEFLVLALFIFGITVGSAALFRMMVLEPAASPDTNEGGAQVVMLDPRAKGEACDLEMAYPSCPMEADEKADATEPADSPDTNEGGAQVVVLDPGAKSEACDLEMAYPSCPMEADEKADATEPVGG